MDISKIGYYTNLCFFCLFLRSKLNYNIFQFPFLPPNTFIYPSPFFFKLKASLFTCISLSIMWVLYVFRAESVTHHWCILYLVRPPTFTHLPVVFCIDLSLHGLFPVQFHMLFSVILVHLIFGLIVLSPKFKEHL